MDNIYEEVARDLYIEAMGGSDNPAYYVRQWDNLNEGTKSPYRAAARRLVDKYQERFLGSHGADWGEDADEPTAEDGPEGPTLQPVYRVTFTVEGRV